MQHAGDDGEQQAEGDDPDVDGDALRCRGEQRLRQQGDERPDCPASDHQADRAGYEAEQDAFDQQLATEASRARAEHPPGRELALALDGARQQQVGDVGARGQQHQRDRAEEDEHGAPGRGVGP